MSRSKQILASGGVARGGWCMIAHPSIMEIMAESKHFDWIAVDMEHTSTTIAELHTMILAAKGSGVDVLVRLPSHDAAMTKIVLDAGAAGIIVPSVNSPAQAQAVVAMAHFPPAGHRGASLCRATDFGRNFHEYFASANDNVLVVAMIEHVDAVADVDAIVATEGLDAIFIGPYDLSASMGLAGQLDHPKVTAAIARVQRAASDAGVAAGIHVVAPSAEQLAQRIDEGFRFVGCGIDTGFLMDAMNRMMERRDG